MANIGKKGLETPVINKKNSETSVAPGSQTGLTQEQKFSLLMTLISAIGAASVLAMLAMLSSWWQFSHNSFEDYSSIVREYNDKRYQNLENRIIYLERSEASRSGNK